MHYCAVCSETRSLIEKWRLPFKSLSFRVYFIIISSVGPTITGKFVGHNGTKDLLKSNLWSTLIRKWYFVCRPFFTQLLTEVQVAHEIPTSIWQKIMDYRMDYCRWDQLFLNPCSISKFSKFSNLCYGDCIRILNLRQKNIKIFFCQIDVGISWATWISVQSCVWVSVLCGPSKRK